LQARCRGTASTTGTRTSWNGAEGAFCDAGQTRRADRAAWVTPLSPFDKTCNFDLAWEREDGTFGVAEVKSITEGNEAFQIRHGLGQVLDYGHRLTSRGFQPKLILVLEAKPRDAAHWKPLCAEHGVILTWGPFFPGVF
jgi:hypothetical protein